MPLKLKRIYETAETKDGTRVLVDRIWPRGVSKESAKLDLWLKEIAPSRELRKWFGHEPKKWSAFRTRYFHELDANPDSVKTIRKLAKGKTLTLLYAAHDTEHNNAVALKEYLESKK